VLVVGSGFLTHGLPYVREYMAGKAGAPTWSMDFDRWAAEALAAGDVDALFDFRNRAPGMPYAHPTVEHFAPLFVTLGAAAVADEAPDFRIDGYWYGPYWALRPDARFRCGRGIPAEVRRAPRCGSAARPCLNR
jgi:4,5-DOPA dioxygenase extradiol